MTNTSTEDFEPGCPPLELIDRFIPLLKQDPDATDDECHEFEVESDHAEV